MKIRNITLLASAAFLLTFSATESRAQDTGAAASEKKPTVKVTKSLHDQLVGYWAPNEEFFLKMIMAEMEKSGQATPESAEFAKAMVKQMIVSMVLEFTKDTATMASPQGKEASTYKINSSEKATGEMQMEVTGKDGKVEKSTVILKGDKLNIKPIEGQRGSPEMMFERISAAEYKKRISTLDKAPKAPAAPPAQEAPKAPKAPKAPEALRSGK